MTTDPLINSPQGAHAGGETTKLEGAAAVLLRSMSEKSAVVKTAVSTNRHSIPINERKRPTARMEARNILLVNL